MRGLGASEAVDIARARAMTEQKRIVNDRMRAQQAAVAASGTTWRRWTPLMIVGGLAAIVTIALVLRKRRKATR